MSISLQQRTDVKERCLSHQDACNYSVVSRILPRCKIGEELQEDPFRHSSVCYTLLDARERCGELCLHRGTRLILGTEGQNDGLLHFTVIQPSRTEVSR